MGSVFGLGLDYQKDLQGLTGLLDSSGEASQGIYSGGKICVLEVTRTELESHPGSYGLSNAWDCDTA